MTRAQRRAHRLAWLALLPVVVALLAFAWARRERTREVFFGGGGSGTRAEAPR